MAKNNYGLLPFEKNLSVDFSDMPVAYGEGDNPNLDEFVKFILDITKTKKIPFLNLIIHDTDGDVDHTLYGIPQIYIRGNFERVTLSYGYFAGADGADNLVIEINPQGDEILIANYVV